MTRGKIDKFDTWLSKMRRSGLLYGVRWNLLMASYFSRRLLPQPVGLEETNYFEEEWDLLIILDACRVDALKIVQDEYSFLESITSINSLGSSSEEWMEATFIDEFRNDIDEAAYITGNPHSKFAIDTQPGLIEEVWQYGWDQDNATIPPNPITDKTIELGRTTDFDRYIVHYMQPHFPTLGPEEFDDGMNPSETGGARQSTVWEKLRAGTVSKDQAWNAYIDNLRTVLDSVATLLENFDAEKVVISADHGNAFGEFGMYGHDGYIPLQAVRTVPWCETTARDKHTRDVVVSEMQSDSTVEERLSDLGYL